MRQAQLTRQRAIGCEMIRLDATVANASRRPAVVGRCCGGIARCAKQKPKDASRWSARRRS